MLCFCNGASAWAQSTRKAGLWEVTSTMTWQQSPMPAGMPVNPNSPFAGGAHTTQVCVTQAQIDRYGALPPQTRGDCQVTNIQKELTDCSNGCLHGPDDGNRDRGEFMDRRRAREIEGAYEWDHAAGPEHQTG